MATRKKTKKIIPNCQNCAHRNSKSECRLELDSCGHLVQKRKWTPLGCLGVWNERKRIHLPRVNEQSG